MENGRSELPCSRISRHVGPHVIQDNKFQEQTRDNHAIFTAENRDNEMQVVRTIRDRIELRQPVNVLRLYPSLPELRQELIDETKF